jgi:hypothetical protein
MEREFLKKKINKYSKKISLLKGGEHPIIGNTSNSKFLPLFNSSFFSAFDQNKTHNTATTAGNENELIYYLLLLLFRDGDNLPAGLDKDNFIKTLGNLYSRYTKINIFDNANITKSFGSEYLIKKGLATRDKLNINNILAIPGTPNQADYDDTTGILVRNYPVNSNEYIIQYGIEKILFYSTKHRDELFIVIAKNVNDLTNSDPSVQHILNNILQQSEIEKTDLKARLLLSDNIIFVSPSIPEWSGFTRALHKGGHDDFIFWLLACSLFNCGFRDKTKLMLFTGDKQRYVDRTTPMKNLASEILNNENFDRIHITKFIKTKFISSSNNGIANLLNQIKDFMNLSAVPIGLPRNLLTTLSLQIYNSDVTRTMLSKPLDLYRKGPTEINYSMGVDSANYCNRKGNFSLVSFDNLVDNVNRGPCSTNFFEQFITYIKFIQHRLYPDCNGLRFPYNCAIVMNDFRAKV